ncbi:VCBS repeat-containing protein [Dyadobacter chenwenxiniae]|uniref:FG-GAP repeat domain-containing protein n=1 Tax=Dyadobacter chenwenxiniae TaxID=2906456 RepID=UPI001FD229E4|nr:VCBS repeat-containing protein [Dyadobacter chenwenxiniae]UON84402.1 VCBS repeat-containing protein [Dyadobacter chenwenxiniae]
MSKYISINYHFLLFLLLLLSCKKKQETLFRSHASSETGIVFSNTLTPNDSINPFTFTNFYNGGGVGIGDVNKDGKPDIFLGGNQVSCRLYLSKIDTRTKKWAFEDITEAAGVKRIAGAPGFQWLTSTRMACWTFTFLWPGTLKFLLPIQRTCFLLTRARVKIMCLSLRRWPKHMV